MCKAINVLILKYVKRVLPVETDYKIELQASANVGNM